MSVTVSGLVWEHYPRGGGELLTALALADHADHGGQNIRPGVTGLARKTRQSIRTVQMQLSRMRLEHWLLPVRHARGGRGFATEYRINPAWLQNPAEFAPFQKLASGKRVQTDLQRVPSAPGKGADADAKGCKAFAPQPSRTVSEPSTTTGSAMEFPRILQGELLSSGERVLERCPPECRQLVLDELEGISRHSVVKSPVGLLNQLVSAVRSGSFEANRGIPVLQERRRRQQEAERSAQQKSAAERVDETRSAGTVARSALEQIRARLATANAKPS
jgi:hypothetical protein